MSHKEVYKAFIGEMCVPENDILKWYPNGKDSIRVTIRNAAFNGEFVFSFEGSGCWIFETMDHFIKRLKEVRK